MFVVADTYDLTADKQRPLMVSFALCANDIVPIPIFYFIILNYLFGTALAKTVYRKLCRCTGGLCEPPPPQLSQISIF